MDARWIISFVLIILPRKRDVAAHECTSSESVACRQELQDLREDRGRYYYATDDEALEELCRKQVLAVNCVNSFAKECLSQTEQITFKTLVLGSDKFLDKFCFQDSDLRKSKTTSQWTESDGRNEGIRCFEQMIHEGDISNLLIDVTTPERIDHFCRRHSELQMCTRQNEHSMSVEENTEYLKKTSGVRKFFVNVCPPGTDITSEYKGNAPCFKFIRNEILSCGSDLPDLDSYKMKNSLQSRCCALRNHRNCLKKVALEHCGKEAASVIEKISLRYFDSKVKECNATSYSCDEKRRTTVKWNDHSTRWQFPTTNEYEQDSTHEKDSKSTTIADWRRSSQHDWKKANYAVAVTSNSVLCLLGSFISILVLSL